MSPRPLQCAGQGLAVDDPVWRSGASACLCAPEKFLEDCGLQMGEGATYDLTFCSSPVNTEVQCLISRKLDGQYTHVGANSVLTSTGAGDVASSNTDGTSQMPGLVCAASVLSDQLVLTILSVNPG